MYIYMLYSYKFYHRTAANFIPHHLGRAESRSCLGHGVAFCGANPGHHCSSHPDPIPSGYVKITMEIYGKSPCLLGNIRYIHYF